MINDTPKKANPYYDIISLPHHVSRKRPQMSLENRAAQFSPFAAVVGHEAAVKETARLTDVKRELDESEKIQINAQLLKVQDKLDKGIEAEVEIEHFQADHLKSGGQYVLTYGIVKKIDVYMSQVCMFDGSIIDIDDIVQVLVD